MLISSIKRSEKNIKIKQLTVTIKNYNFYHSFKYECKMSKVNLIM